MNLADSLKHVLKNKSQNILSDFWKRDFKIILTNFSQDISQMYHSGASSLSSMRKDGLKFSMKEMGESFTDVLLIIKVLPGRIREGFVFFKDDLLDELEKQSDQKQKAIFSIKVIGALTSFTLGVIYNVKRGKTEFSLKGVTRRNAFTRFIVAELIFKITQHFLQRILLEIEQEVSEPEDKKKIRYFRQLLSDRSEINEEKDDSIEGDRAIEMVEELKNFILTGKRKAVKQNHDSNLDKR